jgi:hypothetical protein
VVSFFGIIFWAGKPIKEKALFVMANHDRTLQRIFTIPVPSDINWRDIENLLRHHGAEITEGRGSRIRVVLNGIRAVFHRPHPKKETARGAVRSVREFLENAGIIP